MGMFSQLAQGVDWSSLGAMALRVVVVLLCLVVHEVCHGLAAYWLGDPTAKRNHRLSLNPLRHLDPFGLLMMVVVGFGWAKPVPINPRNFRDVVKDTMLVSFAGPATNFLLAAVFAILLRLLLMFFPIAEWQGSTFWDFFFLMFQTGIGVNISLAWLNLMPIPPLDGSKILWGILPGRIGYEYMQLERYGFILLILLLATGLLGRILYPLINGTANVLISLIVLS